LGFFVFAGLGFSDGLGEAVGGDDDHTIAVTNDDIARMMVTWPMVMGWLRVPSPNFVVP
jgi:hypothetical protein